MCSLNRAGLVSARRERDLGQHALGALCAELFPEWIHLDDWGYPVIDRGPVTPWLLAHARRAAPACPTLALRLEG